MARAKLYPLHRVEPICEVAIQISVERRVDGEGLAGLELHDRRKSPVFQKRSPVRGWRFPSHQSGHAMASIEIGGTALQVGSRRILRQRKKAPAVKDIRDIVNGM